MSDYKLQTNLPPDLHQQFVLEDERMSLEREVYQSKERLAKHGRHLFILTGCSLLCFGISKWIWPDISIYIFLGWIVGVLFESIMIVRSWMMAKRNLKAWNEIIELARESSHQNKDVKVGNRM